MTSSIQQLFEEGLRHHQAGRFAEAEALYRKVLAEQPNHADALHLLGLIALQAGHQQAGVDLIRRAIAINPAWHIAHSNLGLALMNLGRLDESIASFRQAIAIKSDYAEAHHNLGRALREAGRIEDAIVSIQSAIHLEPNRAEAHLDFGNAWKERGKLPSAIAAYRQALAVEPRYPQALYNLGIVLFDLGQPGEAVTAYRQALSLRPAWPEAHNNLGNALMQQGRRDEAIIAYRQAVALGPDYAEGWNNLGNALTESGRYDDAVIAYRQALALGPNHAETHFNFALLLLMRGDFVEGWKEHEWHWKKPNAPVPRWNAAPPRWNGEELKSGAILLHVEEGLGDTLQFIRYLPRVAERCGSVMVMCQPALHRLLAPMPGVKQWLATGEVPQPCDVHCPLMGLPFALDTTLDAIPRNVPYIEADPVLVERWKERIDADRSGRKVGLVWAGRSAHRNDRNRSMPLSALAPLSQVDGTTFYSLQKGDAAAQAKSPPVGLKLIDFTEELTDFADTAALIANLDLVISVDTAIVHLAGAMGKPVWTLLPFVPDWRWMLDRTDSPWYPSMRLFRQRLIGDWSGVVDDVVRAL